MDAYVQGAQRTVDRVVGELGGMRDVFGFHFDDFSGLNGGSKDHQGSQGQTDPI